MCKLFDSLITPILSYSCEIWSHTPGTLTTLKHIETLHRRFLKRISGMHHTTLNAAVYGEFGRAPLSSQWLRLSANYFTRLANLPDGRLAKHALLEALQLEQHGHSTSLGGLQHQLSLIGIEASTANELAALHPPTTREIIQAAWAAQWQLELADATTDENNPEQQRTSQRSHYRSIQPTFSFSCQPYLTNPSTPLRQRSTTARFRCGNHWLASHTSRYHKAAEKQRHHHTPCKLCASPTWSPPNHILLCDSCDAGWHCQCLDPPLPAPPTNEHWYCPPCISHNRCTPTAHQAAANRLAQATRCPHCLAPSEDTQHFLFSCPFYLPIRAQYPELFSSNPTTTHAWLSQSACTRIPEFLSVCFKAHKDKLSLLRPMSPAGSVDPKCN